MYVSFQCSESIIINITWLCTGFEIGDSCLLGRCSSTWPTLPAPTRLTINKLGCTIRNLRRNLSQFIIAIIVVVIIGAGALDLAQAGLKLTIFLPLPPKCWDYRQEIPHPALKYFLQLYYSLLANIKFLKMAWLFKCFFFFSLLSLSPSLFFFLYLLCFSSFPPFLSPLFHFLLL
jgi:hypothetical protein